MSIKRTKQILGMDSFSSPSMLPQGFVRLVENMRPSKGALITRGGSTLTSLLEPAGSHPVDGLDIYNALDGTLSLLAVSNGNLISSPYIGGAGTIITTGLSTSLCTMDQFDKYELIVDQVNGIFVYQKGFIPYLAGIPSPKTYKLIDSFESAINWPTTNGTAVDDLGHHVHGEQSVRFASTSGAIMISTRTFVSPIDLTTFDDGSIVGDDDWIAFYFLLSDPASIPANLILTLGDATLTNYYFVNLPSQVSWPTTLYTVVDFHIPRSVFTAVGVPSWAAISKVKLQTNSALATSAVFVMDYLRVEKSPPLLAASSIGYFMNDDCSNISLWTDVDSGAGAASTQDNITFAPLTTFKFDSGNVGSYADRQRAFSIALVSKISVEVTLYHSVLGTLVGADYFRLIIDSILGRSFRAAFASDGLYIANQAGSWTFLSASVVVGSWQSWRFDLDFGAATCSVSLGGVLQGTGGIYIGGGGVDRAELTQFGMSSNNQMTNVDSFVVSYPRVLDGTYQYRMTFLAENSSESDATLATTPAITGANFSISLSHLPISGSSRIVGRNLYRIGGTSALWRLCHHFDDNTITTYIDGLADVDLGDVEPTPIDGQPYIPKTFCIHNNQIVIGNLRSSDNIDYPSGIMVSEEYSYDTYNVNNFFEVEARLGGGIMWLRSFLGQVRIGKQDSIWHFDPTNLSLPPICDTHEHGGVGPLAVCEGDNNILYFLSFDGVVAFNGSAFQNLSEGLPTKVRNYLDAWRLSPTKYDESCLVFYDHTLMVILPFINLYYPTTILCFDTIHNMWYVIKSYLEDGVYPEAWNARVAVSYLTDFFMGHHSQQYLFRGFVGETDVSIAPFNPTRTIQSIIFTGDEDFGMPETLKDYSHLFLFCKDISSGSTSTLAVDFYLNGMIVGGASWTAELISSINEKVEGLPTPELGGQGQTLALKIIGQGMWEFDGMVEVIRGIEKTYQE